jgi:hypothetical protein
VGRVQIKLLGCVIGVAVLGTVSTSTLAAPTPNKPSTVQVPGLLFNFNGGVKPYSLPKTQLTPVVLLLEGKVRSIDGSHPPPLRELAIELDRNISVDLDGYPTCRPQAFHEDPPKPLAELCPTSIIGSGQMQIEIQFPEAAPTEVHSHLKILNGAKRDGIKNLYLAGSLSGPVPHSEIVVTAQIKKIHNGRFGTAVTITFPKIAGGSGSITSLDLRIKRRLLLDGKRFSPVTARCPDGKLQAHISGEFFDYATSEATNSSTEFLRTCTGS